MAVRSFRGRNVVVAAVLMAVSLALPAVAMAYMEPNTIPGPGGCSDCHKTVYDPAWNLVPYPDAGDCFSCHASNEGRGYSFEEWGGPHGGYSATSNKCAVCHSVHAAPEGGIKLLPAATIVDTCFTCHDGTGGFGVYGAIEARTGVPAGGGHSYQFTDVVPGGDPSGGSATGSFLGPASTEQGAATTLICTDCHAVHGGDVVEAFRSERRRHRTDQIPAIESTRLLKKAPTGAAAPVSEYGSDWCLACHLGRSSGAMAVNHPVDAEGTHAEPFTYSNVALLASNGPTGSTVLGPLAGIGIPYANHDYHLQWKEWTDPPPSDNRGFLMPYPRTPEQEGHAPICQQCHHNSREVGSLSEDGSQATAAPAQIAAGDGVKWDPETEMWVDSLTDNPRFQNFPHETTNYRMLVSGTPGATSDDLCMNCHPPAMLP